MSRKATLYRMDTAGHVCPYGLMSRHLLRSQGYAVDDHRLVDREQTEAFKAEHGVKTTPQTFIDGERIGGYEALRAHLGQAPDPDATTYRPIIALFGLAALMALALAWNSAGPLLRFDTLAWFVGSAMVLLSLQKLRDLHAFTLQFLPYDLLSQRWVPYARVYAYAEAFAGLGMLAGFAPALVAPVALFIGSEGAASVIKAVYIDKRELKCACVGGNSNVPLGFVSLSENLLMVGMALAMLLRL